MRRISPLLLLAVVLAACQDRTTPLAPTIGDPAFAISDALHGDGNEHVFWLPPLVANPRATGQVNLALSPAVLVCAQLAETVCAETEAVAHFTTSGGTGGAVIEIVDQHYQVDWDTHASDLMAGQTYRVFIVVGGSTVAYLDVLIAANGREARTAESDVFGLLDGRTLPLRFRLQQGVLAGTAACELDCAEFTATNEAFEECTINGWACLAAEAGWLPAGFDEVTLVIRRVARTGGACFGGLGLPHDEGCYTIDQHPSIAGLPFQANVYWDMCQSPSLPDGYEMHQRTGHTPPQIVRPAGVVRNSPLDCGDFQSSDGGPIIGLLRRYLAPLARRLTVAPLYAADLFSAQIRSFSDFFYAASVDIEFVEGSSDGETATATFRVATDHHHDPAAPVGGVRVEFAVDGGTLDDDFAFSDGQGLVTASWDLPPSGSSLITATIPVRVYASPTDTDGTFPQATFQTFTPPANEDLPAIFGWRYVAGDPTAGVQITITDAQQSVQSATTGTQFAPAAFLGVTPGTYVVSAGANITLSVSVPTTSAMAGAAFDDACTNGVCGATVQAGSHYLSVGTTLPFSLVAVGTDGEPTTPQGVAWSSANPQVATVSSTGQVTGIAIGTANIVVDVLNSAGGLAMRMFLPVSVLPQIN